MAEKNPLDDPNFNAAPNPLDDPDFGKPPTIAGEAVKGFKSGVAGMKEGAYGLAALGGNVIGSKTIEDFGREGAARAAKEAEAVAPAVGRVEDIGSIHDAALWGAQGLGQLAPFMAASVASGGVGGLAGGALARGAATAAGRAAATGLGANAGMAAMSVGQEMGSITADQAENGGQIDPAKAAGYGVAAGLLDVLPQARIANKFLGPAKAARHGLGREILTQVPFEASTEGIQTGLERAGAGKEVFSPEGISEMGNAAAVGGLGGGVIGGASHILSGGRDQARPAPAPQPEPKLLPAPGQIPIQMGAGIDTGDPAAMLAAETHAMEVQARRDAYEAEQAELRRQNPISAAVGLLPAPGAPLGNTTLPNDIGHNPGLKQQAEQDAADHAAEVYAARDAEEARLAALRASGPLGQAGAMSIESGSTTAVQGRRQEELNQTLNPAQAAGIPDAVSATEKESEQAIAEHMSRAKPLSLEEAQAKAQKALGRQNILVIPLTDGGYTTIAASKLSKRQQDAVKGLQAPAKEAQVTPVQRQMPIATPEAAKARAAQKTAETGVEYQVVLHPLANGKYAIAPKPRTIEGEATRVAESRQSPTSTEETQPAKQAATNRGPQLASQAAIQPATAVQNATAFTQREQPQEVNNGSQEAAATQRPSEALAGNPADVQGSRQAAAGPAAQAGAQAEGPVSRIETPSAAAPAPEAGLSRVPRFSDDREAWNKVYPNETPEQHLRHRGELVDGKWVPYGYRPPKSAGQQIAELVRDAATSPENDRAHPTTRQAGAGNYKKVRIPPALINGLPVTIENPAGSVRVGKDGTWASTLPHHYGYIRKTEGNDGDHVDAFVGPNPESPLAFVVDQKNPKTGAFDEHKVMLGFTSAEAAEAAYRAAYPADWKGMKAITPTTIDHLKSWLRSGPTTQEFSESVGPKLGKQDLDGLVVRSPVFVEETGETLYEETDAKTAVVEARSRVRKLESLLKCLRT